MKVLSIAIGIWAAIALWLSSNAGLSVWGLLVDLYGGVLALIVCTIAMIVRKRLMLVQPAIVLVTWLVIATDATFWIRFAISAPALNHYVRNAHASHRQPRVVGLFRVTETEVVEGGAVRLITTGCMLDECGLAFDQRGEPPVIGEDSYRRLVGGWWQWHRSW